MSNSIRTYLIWSNEHKAWWRPNSRGYTQNMKSAGHYGLMEALEICFSANYYGDDHDQPKEAIVPYIVGEDEFHPNNKIEGGEPKCQN